MLSSFHHLSHHEVYVCMRERHGPNGRWGEEEMRRGDGSREISTFGTIPRRRNCVKSSPETASKQNRISPSFSYLRLLQSEMTLNPLKWKSRNLVYSLLGILGIYFLFLHKRIHHITFDVTIKNSKPEAIWEFVADFSNMKKLNPTIEDFSIVAESGNFDHWKYSVRYTEHLSHISAIQNTGHGHYSIKPDGDGFLISSEHRTCFLSSFACVDSLSEFRFHSVDKDTKCTESVQYECPLAFALLCHKEVMYQRREIMKRLEQHFAMSNASEMDDE